MNKQKPKRKCYGKQVNTTVGRSRMWGGERKGEWREEREPSRGWQGEVGHVQLS